MAPRVTINRKHPRVQRLLGHVMHVHGAELVLMTDSDGNPTVEVKR